jgi:hypothetical protein
MNSSLIKKIGVYPDFEKLKKEVIELQESINLNIISLQYQDINNTEWNNAQGFDIGPIEHEFKNLQPALKGTEIEKLLLEIGKNWYRTRIMTMVPLKVYQIHSDPTPRIHIPILTNDLCRFYFPKQSSCLEDFMPDDGSIYWVDTRKTHTFINCSNFKRIHIVAGIANES